MSHWKCVYPGKRDDLAASGHVAPSWHAFDKRVWQKGELTLTLTNRTQDSRREGNPREYWIITDVNGQERKVTRYRVEVDDGRCIRAWEGSNWIELVEAVKDYLEDPDDWLDDRILEVLEACPIFGCTVKNLAVDIFFTPHVTRNHINPVRMRLMWLVAHGFVYHAGNVGRGTRWAIIGSES
jgi:hypothetical protein